MNDFDDEPYGAGEPGEFEAPENIWLRGLQMLLFAILFGLAESILLIVALVQFLWMVFTKSRNELLVEFGHDMGVWMKDVSRFQSGASDDKPFPWRKWDKE